MKNGINILKTLLISIALVFLVSCSQENKKDIVVGVTDWPECIAVSNHFKDIAERKTEYNIVFKEMKIDKIFEELNSGEIDLFFDSWLPVSHDSYILKYGKNLEKISRSFSGARIGLVVPSYVTVSSIEELERNKEKFKGRIYGIESSSGIMEASEKAIKEYSLSYSLIEGNSNDMIKKVENALNSNEWIVFTGWSPHIAFAKWDLKYLSDYKEIYGLQEDAWILSRKGFAENYPEIEKILKDFELSKEEMSNLLLELE